MNLNNYLLNGSVFAKVTVNGKEPFGSETELLTAKTITTTAIATRLKEKGREDISATWCSTECRRTSVGAIGRAA